MLATNRDLYRAISEMRERHESGSAGISLEQYLLALLGLARQHCYQDNILLSDFYRLVTGAFIAEPVQFKPSWRDEYGVPNVLQEGPDWLDTRKCSPLYVLWEATVIRQIVDLREMDEAGTLEDEHRYFGVDAPRGSRWYNFDPFTYLECGMAGSLGGWEPDDLTGRQFIPGEVAVVDSEGKFTVVKPQDVERPIIAMPQFTWEHFSDFVECGQMYE